MVHSTLLGCQSLKCIAIDGRNGGKGLRVSLPLLLAFLNHRSMGVGLRRRKGAILTDGLPSAL